MSEDHELENVELEDHVQVLKEGSFTLIKSYSLLLSSQAIPHGILRVREQESTWILTIQQKYLSQSLQQIQLWESEEAQHYQDLKKALDPVPLPQMSLWPFLVLFIPLIAWVWIGSQFDPSIYRDLGRHDSEKILLGQWARLWTPLTLHADLHHLMSNMLSGFLFLSFLARRVRWGVISVFVLLAGGLGNYFLALFYQKDHFSVGYSTAVFAILGLLVLAEFRTNRLKKMSLNQKMWTPLFGGLFLLVMTGTGEETDIFAHLFGFLAGIILGLFIPLKNFDDQERVIKKNTVQISLILMSFLWIAICWSVALKYY